MSFNLKHLLAIVTAFVLALALTPIVRALARRWGMVARPKTDRWHKKPTAMLGGIAVFLPIVITYIFLVPPRWRERTR